MEKYCGAGQATDENMARVHCSWVPKATHTHTHARTHALAHAHTHTHTQTQTQTHSENFMVTPYINNIQHFNFQLMHTTLKNVELLKHFKIRKTAPK